jgi:predicted metalloenzyme YecM
MNEILGDYPGYMSRVETLMSENNIFADEITQCDTLVYQVETNDRYDVVKREIGKYAKLLAEHETGGRLVSIFWTDPALKTSNWQIPYIELLQPKPTRESPEEIDGVMCVTTLPIAEFLKKHDDVKFEEKGLVNQLNPYIELKSDGVSVKFHSKHMGSVVELETPLRS